MALDLRLLGGVTRTAERGDFESSDDINSGDEIGESMT